MQKEFAAMEANISAALENMAILVHSQQWFIRAFFFYCLVAFLLYMLTTAEQTFHIRGHLCLGACDPFRHSETASMHEAAAV
jgi:hypothetical protein